jgi:hypothetical protein
MSIVLPPLLFNLVVDRLLTVTNELRFSTFGYADDIVIIVQGKFANTVRELMKIALNMIAEWAVKEDLNISPHKTVTVPFTNRRKIQCLRPLKLHNNLDWGPVPQFCPLETLQPVWLTPEVYCIIVKSLKCWRRSSIWV